MDNFCAGCGSPIFPGNRFCTKCGRSVRQEQVPQYFTREIPLIIKSLSARIMACGIIWTVVAGLQLLCGFVLLCVMSLTSNWNSDYIFALCIYGILGGLNLKEAINQLKYRKIILTDYIGIVWKNRICLSNCFIYIWNAFVIINGLVAANPVALLFALLIAAAIIVDFVCIKIYVKTNSALFLQLENAQEIQEKTYV